MNTFVKEATGYKREKQELLDKMEMLKWKIDELDQLRLLKENIDTYASPQTEADNIEDIASNIAGNTINNNFEGIEYDAKQELGAAAANGGKGSVENHYGKLEIYVDSPVETLPKSGAKNNMDSKLEKTLLLVSLT